MKPDRGGMVGHWADCEECDWSTAGKNCIGLAAQHAEKSGHRIQAETTYTYTWNTNE